MRLRLPVLKRRLTIQAFPSFDGDPDFMHQSLQEIKWKIGLYSPEKIEPWLTTLVRWGMVAFKRSQSEYVMKDSDVRFVSKSQWFYNHLQIMTTISVSCFKKALVEKLCLSKWFIKSKKAALGVHFNIRIEVLGIHYSFRLLITSIYSQYVQIKTIFF